jgi:hypothetical protein
MLIEYNRDNNGFNTFFIDGKNTETMTVAERDRLANIIAAHMGGNVLEDVIVCCTLTYGETLWNNRGITHRYDLKI